MNQEYRNYCWRTQRKCMGGSFDSGDGWSIDCPSGNPQGCPWKGDKIVNLTPHDVMILSRDDENGDIIGTPDGGEGECRFRVVVTIPPSGLVARVKEFREGIGFIHVGGGAIPLERITYDDIIVDLPQPQEGTFLFVSRVVAQVAALSGRKTEDLVFPAATVRDKGGRIIGILSLGRL
jgi:hypothetical protein